MHSTRPSANCIERHADDQHRQQPRRPHDTRPVPSKRQKSEAAASTSSRSTVPHAVLQHHLPVPPPRHTTTPPQSAMPHDPVVRNPGCTRQLLGDHGRRTTFMAAVPIYRPTVPSGTRRPSQPSCRPSSSGSPSKPCRTANLPHGAAATSLSKAAASAHINHPEPPPRHPPTLM